MGQLFLNNFETTFVASVKDVATTGTPSTELDYGILRVSDGAAGQLVAPGSGNYYVLTAYKRAGTVESNIEVMRVTAVDNSVPGECRITVDRAQEGTTAKAYVSGDRIALRLTAGATNGWIQSDDARLSDSRAPTGGAGGVLSGTYPNPGFAVDMATQAELNAVEAAKANVSHAHIVGDVTGLQAALDAKQATLVSGTSIKTINGASLLGSGDVTAGDVTLTGTQTLTNKTLSGASNTITVDGTNPIGFRHVPQNDQTTTYTLVLSDAGKHIHKSGTSAYTVTIPANASVAFPIGTAITFVNSGSSGAMTIAITSDTLRIAGAGTTGTKTLAAYGAATAIKVTSTLWMISGSGLT